MKITRLILFFIFFSCSPILQGASFEDPVSAFKARRFSEAASLWELEANQGNSEAQFQLGILFGAGVYVDLDLEKAIKYLQLARDGAHPDAAYALAAVLVLSEPPQFEAAMKQLFFAAEHGDKVASDTAFAVKRGIPIQFVLSLGRFVSSQDMLLDVRFSPAIANGPSATEAAAKTIKNVCSACHGVGVAGAPIIGKSADWKNRKSSSVAMAERIVRGYKACPPRGGQYKLSDDEVLSAVIYMLGKVKK